VDFSFINGPIGGALVTLVAGFVLFQLNREHQLQQDELKDARSLRDARRERRRAAFERALELSWGAEDYALSWIRGTSNQEVERAFTSAVSESRLIRARLEIEAEGDVSKKISAVFVYAQLLNGYKFRNEMNESEQYMFAQEVLESVQSAIGDVRSASVSSLRALDEPIRSVRLMDSGYGIHLWRWWPWHGAKPPGDA
jgi:hypothetical protein